METRRRGKFSLEVFTKVVSVISEFLRAPAVDNVVFTDTHYLISVVVEVGVPDLSHLPGLLCLACMRESLMVYPLVKEHPKIWHLVVSSFGRVLHEPGHSAL
jgi:hypothetical protein